MNYKIAQFILTPPQRGQSTLEIYVAQPDAVKEALAGKLFALIEIESNKAACLKLINFLINTLNYHYYQNEKMILRERVSTVKIEHIFESALAKTNKKLAEFLQAEKIKLNLNTLNLTIGVIHNDGLNFANLGKNKALLIYKNKIGETAKYRLADITEQTGAAEAKKSSSSVKLFSNVIGGALPRGGYFIFASETFSEYLSAKQIIDITTTLPPAGAAEHIKNTLGKINAFVPFLGIIIKNNTGLEVLDAAISQPAASTKASIDNLVVTEEKTEKLLTPSGLINAKKWTSWFDNLLGRLTLKPDGKTSRTAFLLKDKIFTKKKPAWLSFNKIFKALKNLFIYLIGLAFYFFKIITDKKALAEFWRNLILKIKNAIFKAKTLGLKSLFWYKRLSRINKILFSALVICIIIFSFSLSWQGMKNKSLAEREILAGLITAIEQKQNQIDASLLYNNETGASKLLTEVKELLKQLPKNNQTQIDQYSALAAKHQVQIEKISKVIRLNPVELANFLNLNPSANPKNIILAKEKIYAADIAQSSIYSVDLANKITTAINTGKPGLSRLDFPSLDKNNNIYYLGTNTVEILDLKSLKLSSLEIGFSGDLKNAIDLKQYNNRFYLADADAGQIYRFTRNGNKLASPTAWFNNKEDLNNAVGIDIDGNIYLSKSSGEVLKYGKGERLDLALTAVEPILDQASRIIVSPEENYIYILDPANKRLVVFDKEGKFNCQYTGDKLDNLKDFQIDEANKKIYFLNNAAVYAADMSHLK